MTRMSPLTTPVGLLMVYEVVLSWAVLRLRYEAGPAGTLPSFTAGAGMVATAVTTAGVAVEPARVVGDGTDAVAATTEGVAATTLPAVVVGAGTEAVADTTAGVAVADGPADATDSVNPIRAFAVIVPDAVKLAADVAVDDTSDR